MCLTKKSQNPSINPSPGISIISPSTSLSTPSAQSLKEKSLDLCWEEHITYIDKESTPHLAVLGSLTVFTLGVRFKRSETNTAEAALLCLHLVYAQ